MSSPPTMSRQIAAHSMTKTCETAVKLRPDMSIAAWPSIDPAMPRSACARASATSRRRRTIRNSTASSTIMIGPPTNSAAVNCQPISSASRTPSSTTRLVEAISKAIAAVKLAPLRNSDRASATAAYEHDDDAAPSPVAAASAPGESLPSNRTTVSRRTTDCTTAESAKPRMSGHRISHPMAKLIASA